MLYDVVYVVVGGVFVVAHAVSLGQCREKRRNVYHQSGLRMFDMV